MFKQYISRIVPTFQDRKKMGLYVTDVGYIKAQENYECKTRVMGDYYIIIVLKGEGSFVSRDHHYDLRAGDMYFLFPNVLHSYKTDKNNLLCHMWVGFNGNNAKILFDQIGVNEKNAVVHCGIGSAVFQCAMDIFELMKERSLSASLSAIGHLYALFAGLADILIMDDACRIDTKKALTPIQAAIEFMENNFSNPISISMVAEFAGLSRAYFSTSFIKETGISPIEFLKTLRMNQAIYYLGNTMLTVKEIAHSVGYDNGLYFSKDFSKRFGVCPTTYRKKLLKP